MRKGRDGEKKEKKNREKKKKIRMKIVATTSLPAVDRPNADRWNAARSRQKTDENSDYYAVCQQSTARTTTAGTPHVRANRKVANGKMASVEV